MKQPIRKTVHIALMLVFFLLGGGGPHALQPSGLVVASNSASFAAQASTSNVADQLPIFTDTLADGWANWSWSTTTSFSNATPRQHGTASLAATYNAAWAGLYLHTDNSVSMGTYHTLQFWIHGGDAGGQRLKIWVRDAGGRSSDVGAVTAQANTWTQVTFALRDLNGLSGINDIVWQDVTGGAQPTFYLDEIVLLSTPTQTATPTATHTSVPPTATRTSVPPTATATATAGPVISGLDGIPESLSLSGTVAIEALVSGNNISQVEFRLVGPQAASHVERQSPYFFMGDRNGAPRGWDTTTYPDGDYTLTVTASDAQGRKDTRQVDFAIANASRPLPTASATTAPEQTTTATVAPTASATTAPEQTTTATVAPTATPTEQPAQPLPETGTFLETFDGDPPAPLPWREIDALNTWDVTVHIRNAAHTLEPMDAQHGPDCSPPPENTHRVDDFEETVFQCKNHLMTAINDSGYGVIYLTPDHIVDFSEGEAVIRFDLSTLITSERDWWDVWITPYEENLQLPLQEGYPDLNGPPKRAVQILKAQETLRTFIYDNFAGSQASEFYGDIPTKWWVDYSSFLTPDARRRDTFEIRISKDYLKVGMPDYNFWWIDGPIEPLDWDKGIVQFGHHSYNPTKDCWDGTCGTPNTWHWDNIAIEPAIPFTIIQSNKRSVSSNQSITGEPYLTFDAPAPPDAHLRFAGIGNNLQVSFDGGSTWQAAQEQMQAHTQEDHFRSYWMPIPAGVSQVHFKGETWWGGDWIVRDATIWSRDR